MAFKMKAGKEGPMKKNFGKDISPMNKPLVGNQKNLPDHLKQKILDSPAKLKAGKAFKQGSDKLNKPTAAQAQAGGKKIKEKISEVKSKIKDVTKKAADVNQGVGKSIKRKDSPKKFLGKAVGKVGKFAKKNPALAGMALGGPLGGLAGGLIGAMKMVDKGKKM
jgi:hypothetical protein